MLHVNKAGTKSSYGRRWQLLWGEDCPPVRVLTAVELKQPAAERTLMFTPRNSAVIPYAESPVQHSSCHNQSTPPAPLLLPSLCLVSFSERSYSKRWLLIKLCSNHTCMGDVQQLDMKEEKGQLCHMRCIEGCGDRKNLQPDKGLII